MIFFGYERERLGVLWKPEIRRKKYDQELHHTTKKKVDSDYRNNVALPLRNVQKM